MQVMEYGVAYACVKSINYTLFFWLPLYLHDSLKLSQDKSNDLSTLCVTSVGVHQLCH